MRRISAVLTATAALLLTACGGGDSAPATGPFTLYLTDMPVDSTDIDSVCINFNRITMHYAGREDVVVEYDPLPSQVTPETHCTDVPWAGALPVPPVRLDALSGPLNVALAEGLQVPMGRLTWIRLHFTGDSYVVHNVEGRRDLRCPSCDVTDNNDGRGFKLVDTFDVDANGLALTVDIDLRKSLHEDAMGFVLRPTARVERSETLGIISGEVHSDIISDLNGALFEGADLDTGCAVYVFEGETATVDDLSDESLVYATGSVRYNTGTGLYGYAVAGLPGGTDSAPLPYTLALTCDEDDAAVDEELAFTVSASATVIAGQTTRVDFAP